MIHLSAKIQKEPSEIVDKDKLKISELEKEIQTLKAKSEEDAKM